MPRLPPCGVRASTREMRWHRVQPFLARRAERVGIHARNKPRANWILLDIPHTLRKLLFRRDLTFVETSHPHIHLALQPKGITTLDELHSFLKRNLKSWRDQRVEMIRHDNVRM